MRRQGFTFIEVLISVVIFSVVATAIYTSLYLGIKSWYKEKKLYKKGFEKNRILSDMQSHLQNTVTSSFVSFVGKAQELYCLTIMPKTLENNNETPVPVKIHYYRENESQESAGDLLRKETVYAFSAKEHSPIKVLCAENVIQCAFRYPYLFTGEEDIEYEENDDIENEEPFTQQIIWKDRWVYPDKIPPAIHITIIFNDDKHHDTHERTVLLPQGELMEYQETEEEEEED